MVLLITGKCEGKCWYCPLSTEKKGNELIYANERRIFRKEEVIQEAKSIDALGTGITGGDPLTYPKTPSFIRMLKEEFGDEHHIHLYTQNTNHSKIMEVIEAGLDELRIHPPVETWNNIKDSCYLPIIDMCLEYDLDVGIEIPCIPELKDETRHLIECLGTMVDFINLNELEFSESNWKELVTRGYSQKSDISSSVESSQEMANEILGSVVNTSLHYCSASFKDGVQLKNRIKRRARNVAKAWDYVTDEGLLLKGVIYTSTPNIAIEELISQYDVPSELVHDDSKKCRVELPLFILEEIAPFLEYDCFGVEEYPTADRLEVERWSLN